MKDWRKRYPDRDSQGNEIGERPPMIKTDATKVAPSNHQTATKPVTLQSSDVATAREVTRYAIDCMSVLLSEEERYAAKEGYERPIIASIRAYIADATALLERLR